MRARGSTGTGLLRVIRGLGYTLRVHRTECRRSFLRTNRWLRWLAEERARRNQNRSDGGVRSKSAHGADEPTLLIEL
jgi:hypothetical protein